MEGMSELNPRSAWFVGERPFRHIRAEGVFREDAYQNLAEAFGTILDGDRTNRGGSEAQFRQGSAGYDALMVGMQASLAPQFSPLFERRWIDLLARVLDFPAIPQVDGALHHVPVNSRSGWIHNDFCSGWFDEGSSDEVVFPDRRKCEYFNGTPKTIKARPREYVRAATMIFYLRNDDWKEGAGGGTGLYAASREGLGEMSSVEPVSNSLLLFECSPHSWHRLLGNPGCARNSIILWLHNSLEATRSRWGHGFTRRRPK